MFLIERLIGVGVYCCVLAAVYLLLAASPMKCKTALGFYILVLSGMAAVYVPYRTADLYRIFEMMELYAPLDFAPFFARYALASSAPAGRILYWLFAKTGCERLLPAAVTILCYSIIFYMLLRLQKKFGISRRNLALVLFFLMSTSVYMSVIAGIRMMLAMTLVVFCFFRESVEEKFRWFHVLLYSVALFIHILAGVLLLVRLLAVVCSKRSRPLARWGAAGVGAVATALFAVCFPKLTIDILDTVWTYLTEETYSDPWEYLIGVLMGLLFLAVLWRFRRSARKAVYERLETFRSAAAISLLLSLCCCYVFSIFYRLIGHFVPLLMLPVMMVALQEEEETATNGKLSLHSIVLLYSCVILMLNCARGSLSALKFFVLG